MQAIKKGVKSELLIKMNNKNNFYVGKKAQVGATLTWFVAFMIIIFIVIVFFAAVGYLSSTKGTFKVIPGEKVKSDLNAQKRLLDILEMPVEVSIQGVDKIISVNDAIVLSLEPFITEEILSKVDGDVNKIYNSGYFESILASQLNEAKAKENEGAINDIKNSEEILRAIKTKIDSPCRKYFLILPHGAIFKLSDVAEENNINLGRNKVLSPDASGAEHSKAEVVIPYKKGDKNYNLEIKYQESEAC